MLPVHHLSARSPTSLSATLSLRRPFEVLSDFALAMKRVDPSAVLVTVCGGYEGYMPLAHEFDRGGYEVEARSTYFPAGTADALLACVLTWLREAARGDLRSSQPHDTSARL